MRATFLAGAARGSEFIEKFFGSGDAHVDVGFGDVEQQGDDLTCH
jgi:hypothetical protein